MMRHTTSHSIPLLGLVLTFFLAATTSRLSIPLAEWDHVILTAAHQWSLGIDTPWLFDHPPLYPALLTLFFKMFGFSVEVARAVNILCVLTTTFVMYRLASKIVGSKAAFWASAIYLTNPVTIQGISSLDMADTSLLPLLFLWTAAVLRRLTLRPTAGNVWLLGACLGLCMWAKVSAAIALSVSLCMGVIVLAICSERRSFWIYGRFIAIACGIGFAIYLISSFAILNGLWGRDAFLFPWRAAYTAVFNRGESRGVAALFSAGYSLLKIIVWFSPYLLLIWSWTICTAFIEHAKDKTLENKFCLWINSAATFYFLVHIFIGGTNYGFPRYHVVLLPVVSIMTGKFLAESLPNVWQKENLLPGVIALMASIGLLALIPDPLLYLNIHLKQLLLMDSGYSEILWRTIFVLIPLYGLPFAAACALLRIRILRGSGGTLKTILATSLFITVLFLNSHQSVASYRTGVQYGAVGKEEVVERVAAHLLKEENLLITPEFVYEFRDFKVPAVSFDALRIKRNFFSYVDGFAPRAIIAGLTVNPIDQLQWMLDPATRERLKDMYSFHPIGTYYVWLLHHRPHEPG